MTRVSRLPATLALACALGGIALAGASPGVNPQQNADPSYKPLRDPIPESIPLARAPLGLEAVADGLVSPVWGTAPIGDTGRLFVVDQVGIIHEIDLVGGTRRIFADLSDRLVPLGIFGPGSFDERGFLGLAFHPNYAANGLIYTYTSEPVQGQADYSTMPSDILADHHTVILEWTVPNPGSPASVVDPFSARELLRIDQPQFNHNGGCLNFGPDGMLYIALGDGGGADDRDGQLFLGGLPIVGHGLQGNGGDPSNPLGAILRIDPTGTNSTNGSYGIPADNPFVSGSGLDEIYAYGLRNPYRFSFDVFSGAMIIADVGQGAIEEINLGQAGAHYGWNDMEGTFLFVPNGNAPGYAANGRPAGAANFVDPIVQYDHDEGVAVVGGFVYAGTRLPQLRGIYVFGDWNGRVFMSDGASIVEASFDDPAGLGLSLLGFGQDALGEIYLLGNEEGFPGGTAGQVLRLAPATP